MTPDLINELVVKSRTTLGIEDLDRLQDTYPSSRRRFDKPRYYRFLFHLAPYMKTFVEIGCNTAHASYHVVRGDSQVRAFAIDKKSNVKISHERMIFTRCKSKKQQVLNQFKKGSIDVLFVDGDHSFRGVTQDYEKWLPKVRTGGLILFDDILAPEYGVKDFWSLLEGEKLTFEELHPDNWGFGVLFIK